MRTLVIVTTDNRDPYTTDMIVREPFGTDEDPYVVTDEDTYVVQFNPVELFVNMLDNLEPEQKDEVLERVLTDLGFIDYVGRYQL